MPVPPRAPVRVVVAALAAVLLASCTSQGQVATDGPLTPAAAPSDWTTHDMGPLTVAAPDGWDEFDSDVADADEGWALRTEDVPAAAVQTLVWRSPERDVDAEAQRLVDDGERLVSATDARTEEVDWPGADAAVFVRYDATVDGAGGGTSMTYEYLVLEPGDGSLVLVTAVAPSERFAQRQVREVLASVELTAR